MRRECLKAALSLATANKIKTSEVLQTAETFFDWVYETPDENTVQHHRVAIGYGR